MEICGGQTHSILRYALDELLPTEISLVHGPGCPVCVTPIELIDRSIALAERDGVALCTFGDMMRVPGSSRDLQSAKATGGDVRMVYSPLDAVRLAESDSSRDVVLFAVGFETTAPATALAILQAERRGLKNFSVLSAHVLVPPAIRAILSAKGRRIEGLLAAGHVCTIMGCREYVPLAHEFHVPIVVTGFEPVDVMLGVRECVRRLEAGAATVGNAYARSVVAEGNAEARRLIDRTFRAVDRTWRGMGEISKSGLALRPEYEAFDAAARFDVDEAAEPTEVECIAGEILQGLKTPIECPAFASRCRPERPLGAPMVSSEGACAAYYHYRRSAAAGDAR